MIRRMLTLTPVFFASLSLVAVAPVRADDVKLPPTMAMTAYDTGTSGFNITVAVGKVMKDKYGSDVRVLPAGNDVARLAPLRSKRAVASAMGVGTYFAQEGVFEFGVKEWGPQPLQMLLSSVDCNGIALGVAADTGVKDVKDLKGKRIGFVVGSPALNQNALASLAFGGLTRDDVKIVEFAGYGAMWKGVINNDADAAIGATISGPAKELETSPRGLVWPPLPKNDKAGWERMKKIGSYYFPILATCGAGISPQKPVELGSYPYPIYVVYASQPADQVYSITKAMIDGYDDYKDSTPGASGLGAARQTKNWVVPVHAGAVKALKEAGQWTAEQEAHNNALYKRQEVLASAWADYNKGNPPSEEKAFFDGWLKTRADALAKANMPNGFGE
jgi:TRAP transporter TAXI family solute receptor